MTSSEFASELLASGVPVGLHFSQFGEDLVLWAMVQGRRDGTYVDVGAHHPFRYSNTALLHTQLGWTGVNIDLDERGIAAFAEHRPGDVNLVAAVSDRDGDELAVTTFDDWAVNTADPRMSEQFAKQYSGAETHTVRTRTLASILEEHGVGSVDLLSVDVEGLEMEVLRGNDWDRWCPELLLVEKHGFHLERPDEDELYQYLSGLGYRFEAHMWVTSLYRLA